MLNLIQNKDFDYSLSETLGRRYFLINFTSRPAKSNTGLHIYEFWFGSSYFNFLSDTPFYPDDAIKIVGCKKNKDHLEFKIESVSRRYTNDFVKNTPDGFHQNFNNESLILCSSNLPYRDNIKFDVYESDINILYFAEDITDKNKRLALICYLNKNSSSIKIYGSEVGINFTWKISRNI